MITITNRDLLTLQPFLEKLNLPLQASRVRTKLNHRVKQKIEEFYHDELELLEKFGAKDEHGKLVEQEGNFTLIPETAHTYHQEKAILLAEDIQIEVSELKSKFPFLFEALEISETTFSGVEAEMLDLLLEQMENIESEEI